MQGHKKVWLFGVGFDHLTFDQAVEEALRMVSAGDSHRVVTANPELLERARRDDGLLEMINTADLVLADGVGVVWASKVLGKALPERIAGIDLMKRLIERAAVMGLSVYLLGGRPGVAEQAADRLRTAHPDLRIAGTMHGYFGPQEEQAVLDSIKEARPSMLFVGMGQPQQDLWIARHKNRLDVPLAMGVGGSLDVFAGQVKRAPEWVQKAGLEWLFRLAQQPGRARRHLVLPGFALRVFCERLRHGGEPSR